MGGLFDYDSKLFQLLLRVSDLVALSLLSLLCSLPVITIGASTSALYYLSNIPQDVLELLIERGVLAQFDGGVASCEVQVNKPDPQIYKALLKKYQLKASECVFIDDRLENVQAAFALGFAGIQMKDSVGTLIRSLATCNVTLR